MPVRTVEATRYVTPLREGGSVPAIVEADDDGLYVLKFHGAAQGPKSLVAELIAGEIGRTLGLPVPEIVFVELDPVLAKAEPDPEIQELIAKSGGRNLGLDFLPGSLAFAPAAPPEITPELAAQVVWFDAYTLNVDRTPRNPNLLSWHRKLWLIDHGASLYFHHNWPDAERVAKSPFQLSREHVLLPFAGSIAGAGELLRPKLTPDALEAIVSQIPDVWLAEDPLDRPPDKVRAAYREVLTTRLEHASVFEEEAERARTVPV
ncbi:MAG TPA: HipA family kinase [Thermomicrobiales bacterium]|nr:HipA family kinase [Thermomicrobiales bacterium]